MKHFWDWTRFQKGWVSGKANRFLQSHFHSSPYPSWVYHR